MSVDLLTIDTFERLTNSFTELTIITGGHVFFEDWADQAKTLAMLNVKSWNKRYPDDIVTEEQAEMWYTPSLYSYRRFQNTYELLKTFHFLNYNIDLKKEEMDHKERLAMEYLESITNLTLSYLLNIIPEYRCANWG
jgi:hypothetical protein